MRRMWAVACFVFLGWIFAAVCVATGGLGNGLLPHPFLPALPTVAAPYDPAGDVVSIVPFLFRALLLGAVAAALAGAGKMVLAVSGHPTPLSYAALTMAQMALFIDVFRALAPDWAIYLLHFVRLLTLSAHTYDLSRQLSWGAPWISFAVCVLAVWLALRPTASHLLKNVS